MIDQPQMLRVPRVAKILDVSKKRVYQLIQEGRLDVVRLGPRQTRVLKDSFEAYIEHLKRQERIARGEELPDTTPKRQQRHRVQRSRRPPELADLGVGRDTKEGGPKRAPEGGRAKRAGPRVDRGALESFFHENA